MRKILSLICLVTMLFSCAHKKPTIIAHRGASGYLPEHTLESAAMAHAWNVDFIEPDLVMTKDNHLVVLHDTHLDTTTNVAKVFPRRARKDGRFYAIDFTLREIKKLRVHERQNLKTKKSYFPKRFMYGKSKFEVPTFKEFIELVQGLNKSTGRNIGIYPEIKSPEFHLKHKKDITKKTFEVLSKYGYNQKDANIYVQCFYLPTLKRLREEYKAKFKLVQLIADNSWKESSMDYDYLQSDKGLEEISKYADGVGPWLMQLYKYENEEVKPTRFVENAKKYNLKIHPYTHRVDQLPPGFKNSEELFGFLFGELKVDGIFSDFADTVVY